MCKCEHTLFISIIVNYRLQVNYVKLLLSTDDCSILLFCFLFNFLFIFVHFLLSVLHFSFYTITYHQESPCTIRDSDYKCNTSKIHLTITIPVLHVSV